MTKNQQLTAIAMKSDELRSMLMVYGVPAISIALCRNLLGQPVGTKLGTDDWDSMMKC